ncbi:MAG: FmdE family protein [Deltaproteobacteria bacterium]|jgi:formylmethanofuran dehydrogenase subunit E|nr:FmdE family protein [Deltaproteobacteria bacterium]
MTTHDWKKFLPRAEAFHGHLCSGQILGVRLALKGLELLNLEPGGNHRDLVLFLETDRCMADAAIVVTGVTAGRRRLKFRDYGKAAISFLDLATGQAFRVAAASEPRPPHGLTDLVGFWSAYADEQIMTAEEVAIEVPPEDRPGKPLRRVTCEICGEDVMDFRDVEKEGRIMCRACSGTAYYRKLDAAPLGPARSDEAPGAA